MAFVTDFATCWYLWSNEWLLIAGRNNLSTVWCLVAEWSDTCILNHITILAGRKKIGINLFEDWKCKTFILCVVLLLGFCCCCCWGFFLFLLSQYFVTIVVFNNPAAFVWKAFSVIRVVWMHVLLGVSLSFDPVTFTPTAYLNNAKRKKNGALLYLACHKVFI